MHYLIYVSKAAQPMSREALADILQHSRERNTREGVTGLLIYCVPPGEDRGSFLQLLEGDRGAVDAAWERIAADPRHHTKVVLEEGDAATRAFPDWSMGFRDVEPAELADFEGFSDLASPEFWDRARAGAAPGALELMTSFYANA